jgi:hypothetical protein
MRLNHTELSFNLLGHAWKLANVHGASSVLSKSYQDAQASSYIGLYGACILFWYTVLYPHYEILYSQLRPRKKLPQRGYVIHKIGNVTLPLCLNYAMGGVEVRVLHLGMRCRRVSFRLTYLTWDKTEYPLNMRLVKPRKQSSHGDSLVEKLSVSFVQCCRIHT